MSREKGVCMPVGGEEGQRARERTPQESEVHESCIYVRDYR